MSQKLSLELEQDAQEIEILLSNDFENMSLEELNFTKEKLDKLWGLQIEKRGNTEVIPQTDAQTNAQDFLWFRITQEEHKNESVKIGDLFYTHWGYDQTNTEMYKITKISPSGKTVMIRQIGFDTKKDSEGYMCDQVIPDPDFEIKIKVYDEEKHQYTDQNKHLPDLRVKISRSSSWNPKTKEHQEIGETHLRGSVYYAGDSKHLQNLYPIKKGDSTYRSWYA